MIRVLDQHTAELIAAGEVVERPASVVKELMENAIDAGAKNISVEIERGGTLLIAVQDDGEGIAAEEIALAFLRHATSKVQTKDDLDSITTLGFRGEALASIASVAQVEVLTRTQADEFASLYRISAGKEQGLEPAARPVGTSMRVKNLFYNTPARMKFLKKDASEGSFVTETVTRLALSHPEVAVRYSRDGKQVFATPGDAKLESAAYAVLGASFARGLIAASGQENQYSASGLITSPLGARGSRSMQFFFVNGRFVKNRTMMAALEQAYRGMVMHGKFPGCVLFLNIPPELVDVNVHPAKTEVRFARESDIFDVVYKTVKASLIRDAQTHKKLALGNDKHIEEQINPLVQGEQLLYASTGNVASPAPNVSSSLADSASKADASVYSAMVAELASSESCIPYETSTTNKMPVQDIVREYGLDISPEDDITYQGAEQTPQLAFETQAQGACEQKLRCIGEVFKTYILAEAGGSLCLIDKHAAHERILYEQLAARRGAANCQQLLVPIAVALSAAEKNALLQNSNAAFEAGIEAEDFGGNEVLVRGVPADVEPDSIPLLIEEVAARMALNSKDTQNEKTEWVLHSIACRAAIKAGDCTAPQELLRLASDIMQGLVPPFCPHGRPVVLEITQRELEKQFGRLG